jgi:hypothetical protein
MKKLLIPIFCLLLAYPAVFAQNKSTEKPHLHDKNAQKYAATINKEDLKTHLSVIAADSMEGRDTGTPGQKKAARYIADHFKKIGLLPPVKTETGVSYLQEFQMLKRGWGDVYIKLGAEKLAFMKDMFVLKNSNFKSETTVDLVFGGFGTEAELSKLNVKDKGVIIYENEIKDTDKANLIRQKGAKTVLIIKGKNQEEFDQAVSYNAYYLKRTFQELSGKNRKEEAIFYLSPAAAAKILKTSEAELTTMKFKAGDLSPQSIIIKAEMVEKPLFSSENVLGFLEGTDKKDEIVVITAHYDHVGVGNPDRKGDAIYNGADDDGSGTVSVMEIAEAFAKAKAEGKGPRRSMLFMTVSGEEKGLFGSQFYADVEPVFPLANTVVDLNIDMVGRMGGDYENSKNPDYVYVIGSDKLSTELHQLSENVNNSYTHLKLDYKYNDENDPNRFYYRSDHYNFAKHNIPIIFYFNGTHEDYHQPGDEVSKILFGKIEKIARLVFHTAWEISNQETRLKVDKKGK